MRLRSQSFTWLMKPLIIFIGLSSVMFFLLTFVFFATIPVSATTTTYDCTTISGISQAECNVLVILYSRTNGNNWANKTNWLVTNTPCNWYGVVCTEGRGITALSLYSNTLIGPIPPELGQLTSLNALNLSTNQLTGTIPAELGNLVNLTTLHLDRNQLTGSIPTELGNLSQLTYLGLNANKQSLLEKPGLTGPIPRELGSLTKLHELYLQDNSLNGSIPDTLRNLHNLTYLSVGNNQLTGAIPPELGQLVSLTNLNLSTNRFIGLIPSELGKLTQLRTLLLSQNTLSGSIPAEIFNLSELTELHLWGNKLVGEIPNSLGKLLKLTKFWLYNNAFTGEVPLSIIHVGETALNSGAVVDIKLDGNMLTSANPQIVAFLQTHNPGFFDSQTLPPTNLQVASRQETQIDLTWKDISYQANEGGYEVQLISQTTKESEIHRIASSKQITTGIISNLCPGTTYSFSLRTYTEPYGGQQNYLQSNFTSAISTTTLPRTTGLLALYLLALDSNLDTQYEAQLRSIEEATQKDSSKVAVVLLDRKGDNNTEIFHIECGIREKIVGLPNPNLGRLDINLREYNMTVPSFLGTFILWARQQYDPIADNSLPPTMLSYVGHGVAIAPETDISKYLKGSIEAATQNESQFFLPPTSSVIDMTPDEITDATSKTLISPYTLAQALKIGTEDGAQPLMLLDIVHCFGGTIEEFYELSNHGGVPFADVMIGSPNYTYAGAEMLKQALLDVQLEKGAIDMAKKVVHAYETILHQADLSDGNLDVNHPRIIVAVESNKISFIKNRVDELSTKLLQAFADNPVDTMSRIELANDVSQKFDTTNCQLPNRPQDYKMDREDGLSDLGDFMAQLETQFETTSPTIGIAAGQIISIVNSAVITITQANGSPWFATDSKLDWTFSTKASGIGFYTDFNGIKLDGETYVGWQAYWYTRSTLAGANPHPYAFVQNNEKNWSDVFLRFWQVKQGETKEVETYACTTSIPEVRFVHWIYLPLISQ